MKTVGVRALRENPGILSQAARDGDMVLVTNRSAPISLSVPFDDDLLKSGVHVSMAVKLYEEGLLTLVKASRLAHMPVEQFLSLLSTLDVVSVDQTADELASDLAAIDPFSKGAIKTDE